jgi:6-phosphogluconolactonase
MKARTLLALCLVAAAISAGVFLTGCASGHKEFLYVVGQGTNEIFEFRVQSNGTLVPLGAPNFPAGSNPTALETHTSGDFLYIADFSGDNLTLLDINKSNGNLSVPVSSSIVQPVNPPNIFNTGAGPSDLAMSPRDPFLYVANQSAGTISSFTVDPGSGSLTALATTAVVQPVPPAPPPVVNPKSVAISAKGDLLFVANPAQGTVAVLTIDAKGVLGYAPGSPFSMGAGATPNSVAVEHSGRFLYVADTAHNAVLGFSIQQNGSLTAINGSPFAAGLQPSGLAVDPQGALLFAANTGSNNISAYLIDPNTGALGAVKGSPFATGGSGPSAVAVDSNSTAIYVTEQGTHDIAALGIQADGSLKPLTGSPYTVATAASAIVLVRR